MARQKVSIASRYWVTAVAGKMHRARTTSHKNQVKYFNVLGVQWVAP